MRGIHRWPVNSTHKWPVTRKMFPFDDVIMHQPVAIVIWWSGTSWLLGFLITQSRSNRTNILAVHSLYNFDVMRSNVTRFDSAKFTKVNQCLGFSPTKHPPCLILSDQIWNVYFWKIWHWGYMSIKASQITWNSTGCPTVCSHKRGIIVYVNCSLIVHK